MHIVDDVLGGSGGLEAKEADFGLKGLRFESTICQVITELLWAPFPHTAPQAPKRKKDVLVYASLSLVSSAMNLLNQCISVHTINTKEVILAKLCIKLGFAKTGCSLFQ